MSHLKPCVLNAGRNKLTSCISRAAQGPRPILESLCFLGYPDISPPRTFPPTFSPGHFPLGYFPRTFPPICIVRIVAYLQRRLCSPVCVCVFMHACNQFVLIHSFYSFKNL